MHIADISVGNLGANGVVGGGQPIACGAALTLKMKKKDNVVVCFFGDGASNEGSFHGDITMDNILWNEGEIVSLLDFEHSVIAPAEIDLNSFINLAFFDEEGTAYIDDNNVEEFQQYNYEITKLLRPILKQPDGIDLVFGYAILFTLRFLDFWLENPKGSIVHLGPYIKLVSFADKRGDYLSKILDIWNYR